MSLEPRRKSLDTASLIIVLATITIGILWTLKFRRDQESLKVQYQATKQAQLDRVTQEVHEKLNVIYQTVRTISLLPGVRTVDRHAKNFNADSKMAMQQIYNNAYLNIKVSEVYLLPATLDPHKIDPTTGKPEEPIITFDELIVVEPKAKSEQAEDAKPELEEVEIEEYRLMKTQLETLRSQYPTQNESDPLSVPMISGAEVITCDNAEFTEGDLKSGNNEPRNGIVFTVPVYGMDLKFRGAVSAVVRSRVLKSYLPAGAFGLSNSAHQLQIFNSPSDALTQASSFLKTGTLSPDHIFSGKCPVRARVTEKWS